MKRADWWLVANIALVLTVVGAFALLSAHMEARTYNRVTGADVTTWEALWVQLRIQAEP